jgi:predicted TIM-barrel fold metal-dependent hydrolase
MRSLLYAGAAVALPLAILAHLRAQQAAQPVAAPTIEEYEPRAMLAVEKTETPRAKFPFVDIHTHDFQRSRNPEKYLADMDKINMRIMVSSPVNGSFGARTKQTIDAMRAHPQSARFASMTNIDFTNLDDPNYGERAALQLETDVKNGAVGLKVHKAFGMSLKDSKGERIRLDDPRFNPVWRMAAKHKVPVLIHTADPKPLFDPMDKYNERWLELRMRPGRAKEESGLKWDEIIGEQHRLFANNPQTTFINAHMGWMAHDLAALGALLDRMPNVQLEIAAVLGELGRQPRAARRFFTKYQNRVLFGKDTYNVGEYPFYFRMLETDDEWIDNIRKYHGLWKLYALDLPDEVLKKVYYKNALRIVPNLSAAGFPQ